MCQSGKIAGHNCEVDADDVLTSLKSFVGNRMSKSTIDGFMSSRLNAPKVRGQFFPDANGISVRLLCRELKLPLIQTIPSFVGTLIVTQSGQETTLFVKPSLSFVIAVVSLASQSGSILLEGRRVF